MLAKERFPFDDDQAWLHHTACMQYDEEWMFACRREWRDVR